MSESEGEASAEVEKPCRLLAMPAELRNRIVEEAVHEDVDIRLDKDLLRRLPRWTRACKQIHAEATPVWLATNRFTCDLSSCDDFEDLLATETECAKLIKTDKMNVTITINEKLGRPAWNKVVTWARHVHAGGNWGPVVGTSDARMATFFVATAVELAALCRDLPWEQCVKVIESARDGTVKMLRVIGDMTRGN